jgi:hypothetical protein
MTFRSARLARIKHSSISLWTTPASLSLDIVDKKRRDPLKRPRPSESRIEVALTAFASAPVRRVDAGWTKFPSTRLLANLSASVRPVPWRSAPELIVGKLYGTLAPVGNVVSKGRSWD